MTYTGNIERALRALQKYDELVGSGADVPGRHLLIEAETALGAILGLTCTGVEETPGYYDHSGDTCPVHEWLVPEDHAAVTAVEAFKTRRWGTARYRGITAVIRLEDSEYDPACVRVVANVNPPMSGYGEVAFEQHPKAPEPK